VAKLFQELEALEKEGHHVTEVRSRASHLSCSLCLCVSLCVSRVSGGLRRLGVLSVAAAAAARTAARVGGSGGGYGDVLDTN